MAPRKFRMHSIVDVRLETNSTTGARDVFYTVRWINFPSPEDYTEETRAFVVAHGGQGIIRTFDAWVRYDLNAGEHGMTRDEWEDNRASQRLAANQSGTCLIRAVRTATRLAGIPDFCTQKRVMDFAVTTVRPTANMMWEDAASLIRFCNKEQKKLSAPEVDFIGKKANNLVRKTLSKYVDHRLNVGVYLCCGVTKAGAGHCFVLDRERDGQVTMYGSVGARQIKYNEQSAQWIRRWKFVIPIKPKP